MNSSPSRRVRLATEQIERSSQRIEYGKDGNVAHVDAAADDGAAFADGFKSLRHQVAYRRKDDSRIKFFGRQFVRAAGPNRTEIESEFFCFFVCGPGESIDFPLLILCHLRDDVRGSAEAVNAEPLAVPRFNQTSVSDQTRAQKWRGFRIAIKI